MYIGITLHFDHFFFQDLTNIFFFTVSEVLFRKASSIQPACSFCYVAPPCHDIKVCFA